MKSLTELEHLNPDPLVRAWVLAALSERDLALQEQDKNLHQKDIKIQALILELAHLKRMHFGVRSESMGHLQPDLFEEFQEDQAEVESAIEQVAVSQGAGA